MQLRILDDDVLSACSSFSPCMCTLNLVRELDFQIAAKAIASLLFLVTLDIYIYI
jgi:hypothetical protein